MTVKTFKRKYSNKRKYKKKSRKTRTKKNRRGGASSYIAGQYNAYKQQLTTKNDVDKLRELDEGVKMKAILDSFFGVQGASKVTNAMRMGYLRHNVRDGDLEIKLFLDFLNFGMIYTCDFTDDGETLVTHIKLAFPNNTFKSISYKMDEEEATEGMADEDKGLVSMFVNNQPNYDDLMSAVEN